MGSSLDKDTQAKVLALLKQNLTDVGTPRARAQVTAGEEKR